MKQIACVALIGIGLMFGCQSARKNANHFPEYYTKVVGIISPYIDYTLRGKINEELRSEMNHYEVIRDEHGRIQSISFFKGSSPSEEAYFATHRVEYEYRPGRLVRSYFDSKGNRASMQRHYYQGGDIHQEVFTLNASGQKTHMHMLDSAGNRVVTGLGTYEYEWETIDDQTFIQRQTKQDGSANYLTNYFPFTVSKMTLDDAGHLYEIINVDPNTGEVVMHHSGYAQVVFDFDQFGNELGWKFLDAEGQRASRLAFEEMDYGYSEWTYSPVWRSRELGQMAEYSQRHFGINKEPVNNDAGIHRIHYIFNKWNQLTSIAFFDATNAPILSPYYNAYKLEIEYDVDGNRTEVRRFEKMEDL